MTGPREHVGSTLFGDLELSAEIVDEHDAGAHDPPPCRYTSQRSRACGGTLHRVEYPGGETWIMCASHVEGGKARGFLSRARITNWLPPLACTRCTHAPVSLGPLP